MTRTGFLEHQRSPAARRPVSERVLDYREVYLPLPVQAARQQAARCMDCGVPFCHHGCPLGNLIPEWNALVERDEWQAAAARLHATNNFPELTGRLCPAPCEPACVLAVNDSPVTIKHIEQAIVDRAFEEGWVRAEPPAHRSGRRVAVVGSGPAGLAAAQQLNRAGHLVTVYEKADRAGGLLRYGIPDFKLEKWVLDRRIELLEAEGIVFETGCEAGVDVPAERLLADFDAIILAIGAEQPRDLSVPGRALDGVHPAMDYLVQQNRRVSGVAQRSATRPRLAATDPGGLPRITARGKDVVIIGGGDTGADCLGNVIREGCASVRQLYLYPQPPATRPANNPWPEWPLVLQTHPAHEEGGSREHALLVTRFSRGPGGNLGAVHAARVRPDPAAGPRSFTREDGEELVFDAQLVLLAIGFEGCGSRELLRRLGVPTGPGATIETAADLSTGAPNIFAAGDASRGASLIVWAIHEGRVAARSCERALAAATPVA